MFNEVLRFLIKLIMLPFTVAMDIISYPIANLFHMLIPSFSLYNDDVNYFLNNIIIKGVGFCREVFLEVTHFPRPLFYAFITAFSIRVSFHFLFLFYKWLVNLYYVIRGNRVYSSKSSK